MRRNLLLAIMLVTLALSNPLATRADEARQKGPAPNMARARLAELGEIAILQTEQIPEQYTVAEKVTITELRTEIIGGRAVAKPVEVVKEVPVVRTRLVERNSERSFSKEAFHVLDVAGKKVEGDALAKALAKEKPVLVAYGKKPIDPFYADFFKPGTLVVYVHEAPPQPARAAPVPIRAEAIPLRAVPVPAVPDRVPEVPPK